MDPNRTYLETQIEVLTNRLSNAEDQIRQLINLSNAMRSDIAAQQRVIQTFTMINAERKLSNSKSLAQAAAGSSASTNGASVPLDTWEFNDNMDIDWDAFDGIDVSTLASSSSLPKVTIQEPTKSKITSLPVRYDTIFPCGALCLVLNLILFYFLSLSISSHKHSRSENGDSEYPHEIKAMRYDSLDRILAYTVKASAVSDKSILKIDASINYDEERKTVSGKIFRYLNVGDMNALSKLVSESFCDSLVMYFCQISETIYGKAEAMMLFSLLYESYPDGVWKQSSAEVHGKVVTTYYTFTGTSVFDMPLAVSFHQVKEHERGHKMSENSEEMAGNQIVRNVAEMAGTQQRNDGSGVSPINHLNNNASFNLPPAPQLNTRSHSFTTSGIAGAQQRGSLGAVEIDLTTFSIYDRTGTTTPRSADHDAQVAAAALQLQSSSTDASLPVSDADKDVIKIPRSKGNESFRLDVSRTGTIQPASLTNKANNRPPSMNSELMANALIKKSESERRKCEVTFNDYNLIVQIVITPAPK